MKRRLLIRHEAEEEIAEAALWYEERRRGCGRELIEVAERALSDIAEMPGAYPRFRGGFPYRKLALPRFPFLIFFRIDGSRIRVIAFAHCKRKPGYWMSREGG